uniref:Uncharacterized protein n=1 Tax=Aegilops tauschii subsp. strangulata TaxID=200361 RepID=A0A453K821_AEGTS
RRCTVASSCRALDKSSSLPCRREPPPPFLLSPRERAAPPRAAAGAAAPFAAGVELQLGLRPAVPLLLPVGRN